MQVVHVPHFGLTAGSTGGPTAVGGMCYLGLWLHKVVGYLGGPHRFSGAL